MAYAENVLERERRSGSRSGAGGGGGYGGLYAGGTSGTGLSGFDDISKTISDAYGGGGVATALPTETTKSNLAASPYNVQLTDLINAVNRASQQAANVSRLGPQGQATQDILLTNAQRQAQGLLDPETEQMLQSGIAAGGYNRGMGVDSAALGSAYRRALGQNIAATEALGQKSYLDLLAANPAAPIFDMSKLMVSPELYSTTALNEAKLREDAKRAREELAYKYYAANLAAATRGGGGGGGGGGYRTRTTTEPEGVGGGYPGAGGGYVAPEDQGLAAWMDEMGYDEYGNPIGGAGGTAIDNTRYNPATDASEYTYGLEGWL